jgi:hypothetical protein
VVPHISVKDGGILREVCGRGVQRLGEDVIEGDVGSGRGNGVRRW